MKFNHEFFFLYNFQPKFHIFLENTKNSKIPKQSKHNFFCLGKYANLLNVIFQACISPMMIPQEETHNKIQLEIFLSLQLPTKISYFLRFSGQFEKTKNRAYANFFFFWENMPTCPTLFFQSSIGAMIVLLRETHNEIQ